MKQENKTKEQLVAELRSAQRRIAKLEKINETLRESEHNFRITMEQSAVSMQVYTLDGVLRHYNRAFEKLFDIDAAEFVNKYNVFEDKKVKEVGAIPFLKKAISGETVYNFINKYDSKVGFQSETGRQCWLKSCFYPLKDSNGNVHKFVIMHEDITELKQHELELEALVKAQTASLEQQNKELTRLLHVDGLTQIANRRCFEEMLEQTWQKLLILQQSLTLIFIDIDRFKSYNDFYGHQMGDFCLNRVAQAIHSAVTHSESLTARYGGEEFVVMLPDTQEAQAIQVVHDIQNAIHTLQVSHETSTVSAYITCSLGIASIIPNASMSMHKLITLADSAMYTAKAEGGNRYKLANSIH